MCGVVKRNFSFGPVVYPVPWAFEDPPKFLPFWFEKVDDFGWKKYMTENSGLPFVVGAFYILVIFGLKAFMNNRPRFDLRTPLIIWNWALGIFSCLGFVRMSQELIYIWTKPNGLHKSICIREGFNEPLAFWAVLFTLSKFVELGDTLFVVLRKQQLLVIQWYHHFITMCFVWQVYPASEPIQRWYGVMNYGVHSIMYPYYALRAARFTIPERFAFFLTSTQLAQMVVGVTVNIYSVYVMYAGEEFCARDSYSVAWSLAVYASFVLLFANFLVGKYFRTDKSKTV